MVGSIALSFDSFQPLLIFLNNHLLFRIFCLHWEDQKLILRCNSNEPWDCLVLLDHIPQFENFQLYLHRLDVLVFAPEWSIINYFFIFNQEVHFTQLDFCCGVELMVGHNRAYFLQIEETILAELEWYFIEGKVKHHQNVILSVFVLNLLQTCNFVVIGFLVIFIPLKRSGNGFNSIVQFLKYSIHYFLRTRLDYIHQLIDFLLEYYEISLIIHKFEYSCSCEADALFREVFTLLLINWVKY